MTEFPLLSFTTFLPLIGALLIFLFVRGEEETAAKNAKYAALWISVLTFILSLTLWFYFDPNLVGFQFVEKKPWIEGYNISYHLGIDGISLFFIILTTFLTPICILASWNSINRRVHEYLISFLLMETFVIGSFAALDFVLFYLFFESVLIPMFLIIGIWGGDNRFYAAFKFFLYTLLGSVFLLIALLYIYLQTGTTDIPVLMERVPAFSLEVQKYLFLALLASFAVKLPMWPVHTWLPDAHVQAPTAGSVILAGVLLKLGGYGFLRFSLPMLPDASVYYADFMFILSVIAVVYTSFVALMQTDMKKLIAYSSVAHMGFVTIGIFTFNTQGVEGAMFQMISHGLVSAALFLCVGVVYDRLHTRDIAAYGGVVERLPSYALVFMVFTMASVGLPGTSGFVGELLVLLGAFKVNKVIAAIAATGVVLGACYMLWLYKRVVFGEITRDEVREMLDLSRREKVVFVPIVVMVIVLGVYPALILDFMHTSVDQVIAQVYPGNMSPASGGKWEVVVDLTTLK